MKLDSILSNQIATQNGAQTPDAFGIEVELEGQNLNAPISVQTFWTPHHDGSLRKFKHGDYAIEFVSRQPYPYLMTQKSINVLFSWLNSPEVKVYESYRTSIHVHVNYAMETYRTIYNAMTLSLILDELLVSQNGEHRIGNNFCLRAKDAMGQVIDLIRSIERGHNFFDLSANDRYSSINFAALLKFGSIEYRSLECTTHEGRLMHWIRTLQYIKDSARLYKNPTEIIQQFSQKGPYDFLQDVLSSSALKYFNVPGFYNMLFNGMRIAQDFAYCSDWKE